MRSIGFDTSSKLEDSSDEDSSSLSANLDAIDAIDAWLSFIVGAGPLATGAATGAGGDGSLFAANGAICGVADLMGVAAALGLLLSTSTGSCPSKRLSILIFGGTAASLPPNHSSALMAAFEPTAGG